jgi:hypothetical protein
MTKEGSAAALDATAPGQHRWFSREEILMMGGDNETDKMIQTCPKNLEDFATASPQRAICYMEFGRNTSNSDPLGKHLPFRIFGFGSFLLVGGWCCSRTAFAFIRWRVRRISANLCGHCLPQRRRTRRLSCRKLNPSLMAPMALMPRTFAV